MLILIVDHDANDVHLFFEAIKSIGFGDQCIAAYNGAQALEIVNSGVTPALIFMDASMEGMTAIKTIKALRKERRCKEIPMVIFGSIAQKAGIGVTRMPNNTHYMVRPLKHSDLPLAVKDFLTLHTGK
jgi:CheY-like chemotaxis protein